MNSVASCCDRSLKRFGRVLMKLLGATLGLCESDRNPNTDCNSFVIIIPEEVDEEEEVEEKEELEFLGYGSGRFAKMLRVYCFDRNKDCSTELR